MINRDPWIHGSTARAAAGAAVGIHYASVEGARSTSLYVHDKMVPYMQ